MFVWTNGAELIICCHLNRSIWLGLLLALSFKERARRRAECRRNLPPEGVAPHVGAIAGRCGGRCAEGVGDGRGRVYSVTSASHLSELDGGVGDAILRKTVAQPGRLKHLRQSTSWYEDGRNGRR